MTKEEANLHKGDYVYFARIIPKQGIYDVLDLKIRTVEDTYFVAQDSDKTLNNAEVNKPKVSDETYYEEY